MDSNSETDQVIETMMVDASLIESMYARGEIILSKEQLEQLDGREFVELPRCQFEGLKKKKLREPDVVWLNPLDAVYLLSRNFGSDANAKSAILERLRDGGIECTASWFCVQPDVGRLPHQRPRQTDAPNGQQEALYVTPPSINPRSIRLGGQLWRRMDDLDRDFGRIDWLAGMFVASYNIRRIIEPQIDPGEIAYRVYRERMVAADVRFNKEHIERMLPTRETDNGNHKDYGEAAISKEMKRARSMSGPKRGMDWENWVAEVVVQAAIHGIDLGQSQAEFNDEIANILESKKLDAPDLGKVSRTISAVMIRWREAQKSGELKS